MVREKSLSVIVTTPEGKKYEEIAYAVHAEAVTGGITILPNHAPIVAPLKISPLRVVRNKGDKDSDYIAIGSGIMEVRDNVVNVLANVAERARDIDLSRAEKAKSVAEEVLRNKKASKQEIERARIALNKAVNRIGVSRHRKI